MDVVSRAMGEDVVRMTVTIAAGEMRDRIKRAAIAVAYGEEITPDPATTPEAAVAAKLGQDEAQARIAEQVMRDAVPFALGEKRIDIVGAPTFLSAHPAREDASFEFSMECVVVPSFELSSYEPVEITVLPLRVSDDAVAEQLAEFARQHAVWETDPDKAVVEAGDTVELAMETEKDGERVPGLCRRTNRYTAGSETMPDAFDEAVVGMEVGKTAEVTYLGPSFETDESGNPLMEEYRSKITVKRILRETAPEITDAWVAATVPGCATVGDLERKLRVALERDNEAQQAKHVEMLAAGELVKRFDARISDVVYQAAMDEAKRGFHEELAAQGLSLEEFLEREHIEEQQLTMSLMMQVKDQLVRQFSLNAWAEHEGLVVEDEDLDAFFESIAPGRGGQARADFERSGRLFAAERAALRLKANRHLVAHAIVCESTGASS